VRINHNAKIAPAQVRRKIHNPFQFSLQEKNAIKIFYLRSILFIYLDTLLTQCYEDSPVPRNQSKALYQRAREKIPGGVNSPVRAWQAVGGTPAFIARGKRAYLFDTEGRKYIDFVASWGPLILGHAHPKIVQQIKKTAARGTTFGAPTEGEVELAELVCRLVPSIETVRLVSSGTEATMSAVRLARACTRRTKSSSSTAVITVTQMGC